MICQEKCLFCIIKLIFPLNSQFQIFDSTLFRKKNFEIFIISHPLEDNIFAIFQWIYTLILYNQVHSQKWIIYTYQFIFWSYLQQKSLFFEISKKTLRFLLNNFFLYIFQGCNAHFELKHLFIFGRNLFLKSLKLC